MSRRQRNLSRGHDKLILPISAKTIRSFLRVLSDGWTANRAATITGISIHRWRHERRKNKSFARRWDRAIEEGVATLEDALHQRAVKGIKKPIVSQGRVVVHVREYSDTLLKLGLSKRSKRYADASHSDNNFNESAAGAAEKLLSKLDGFFKEHHGKLLEPGPKFVR